MDRQPKKKFFFSKTPYAELHLHLGGAISPRVLWQKVTKYDITDEITKDQRFDRFYKFQAFFEEQRTSLKEYLQMHEVVEPLQKKERLGYFLNRLLRGAYNFENLSYLELRHCPYGRTNHDKTEKERIREMREIVMTIHEAIQSYSDLNSIDGYPISVKQILCMHSRYSADVNNAITDLAIELFEKEIVIGIDIAGGEDRYNEKFYEIMANFQRAFNHKLNTTAHIFETKDTPARMVELIPFLKRIGHGIELPLTMREFMKDLKVGKKCLEICPTTYIKCGRFDDYSDEDFKKIFRVCEEEEIDIVIGTDNSGMHNVRLQKEFENLLLYDVISYDKLNDYRQNAFKHAFGLSEYEKDIYLEGFNATFDAGKYVVELKV